LNTPASIEHWLIGWAEWQNLPPPQLCVNGSSQHEIIDGVVCRPDGGMADFVARHRRLMNLERQARAVADVIPFLPSDLKRTFDATYVGLPLEVPRRERDAAERMGISRGTYQKLHYGLLCFFAGVNFKTMEIHFDTDVSTKRKGRVKCATEEMRACGP
jgi:hypothetical protein